jgi:DNA-binding GntR family transcriptional regulator
MALTKNTNTNQDNSIIYRESIEDKLYQNIRRDIRSGKLPQGIILVQEKLAEKYGVSRIPVRSALQLIEKDNLIHRINNKGNIRWFK